MGVPYGFYTGKALWGQPVPQEIICPYPKVVDLMPMVHYQVSAQVALYNTRGYLHPMTSQRL